MDATIFLIMLIPVAISLSLKFLRGWEISWLEFAAQFVIGAAVLSMIWAVGNMSKTGDREVWNGAVVSKDVNRFRCPTNTSNPCRNGYDCNCYEVCTPQYDAKGNVSGQSCTTHCDTCYRYPWEQDWYVRTSLGPFEISRVDAQGANEPGRWTSTKVGDPVSVTKPFKNWVKASAGTLFRDADSGLETYAKILPEYPIQIFDYYRIDRVVTPNVRLANKALWNDEISRKLAILGSVREINAVFVFVDGQPRDYAYALRRKWNGFKQNDAVIVVGLRQGKVEWTEVMSWSKKSLFNVQMKQAMDAYVGRNITEVAPREVLTSFETIAMASFERRPMKEFEYLKGDIKPPSWLIWISVILAVIIGGATSFLFNNIDLDESIFNRRSNRYNNRYY